MRLSSLKLSGFKSFADSTTLHFKANRTAVVGPNGCGKSNVIDAIRWVMGESNARQLRGGTMQDVIFTGTAKRKPVSVASVELRFDNTYGKLGGAYNAYTELAVRRQVNKEGKSEYFLNGTKCRRKDITDIFLGTGLGPRSYAIIEQGMINRLVDAKPEEMRVFIEEAAGVSRYQARRKETTQHLEHAHQNLSRLEDIAAELRSQLKSLKRQAEAAIQYQTLEQNIRQIKIEILSFQHQQSQQLQQEYIRELDHLGENFKLIRSELTTLEHDLTQTNQLFQRLLQQSKPLQQQSQQAEKKLAELKANFEHKQSLLQQNAETLKQLQQEKIATKEKIQLIEIKIENIQDETENQQTLLQQKQVEYTTLEQENIQLKTQQQTTLEQFTHLKTQVDAQNNKKMQLQQANEQLLKNIARLEQQKQMLSQQISSLQQYDQTDEKSALEQQKTILFTENQNLNIQIEQQQANLNQLNVDIQARQTIQQDLQTQIQILQSEQKNLQQLLLKIQPKSSGNWQTLLHSLELSEAGKKHAVLIERFLAKWLTAYVLTANQPFQKDIARQLKIVPLTQQADSKLNLSDWIQHPTHSLWQHVFILNDLQQAQSLQNTLQYGQSFLTLDGYHVGQNWMIALSYDAEAQNGRGLLSYQVRLDEIETILAQKQTQFTQQKNELATILANLNHSKIEVEELKKKQQKNQQQIQQIEMNLVKIQSTAQAFLVQKQQMQQQMQQLDEQLEEDYMQRDDLEIDLHALALKLEQILPQYQVLQLQHDEFIQQFEHSTLQLKQQQLALDANQRELLQIQQQLELLEKDHSFLQLQYQKILAQIEQAQGIVEPTQLELPTLESDFEQHQQHTEKLQNTWLTWQTELNLVQEKQAKLTEQRHLQQQNEEKIRQQLEEKRLAWQTTKSDLQHYSEQLQAIQATLLTQIQLDLPTAQKALQIAQQQFEKIGAVNLTASAEYEEVSQRYNELTHQIQDVENTVTQLESAMKSIDQETRKLFMDTFDRINFALQELFPKVFNGGEASLTLEDGWQSGVKLMARPPGKRNSSLALLSGGEKALTALALVFAIFRLNPAPFCVLDEVDAPLDDANVRRFCNLVKELSEQVQFIYITHNKLAMTMATDLLGVTMPEAGTSKLVTVNLEDAAEYGLVAEA